MESTEGPEGQCSGELWEVLWCFNGWNMAFEDRVPLALPAWAAFKYVDDSRPLVDQVGSADVLIPTSAQVTADVIAAAARLKLVVQPATGYNNIDVRECAARGIPVCTCPGVNAVSTAEGALTTILMLARQVNQQQENFRQGRLGVPVGMQLHGRTLGIIGLGTIGKHLGQLASAFGMRVLATTSKCTRAELEYLLRSADVVSVHCPLTEATYGLIGKEELAIMQPGALLVNYSRGEVLNEKAVTEAVMSGKLGGLGLDVHWGEPGDPSKPIYMQPNVIAFPHTGGVTTFVIEQFVELIVSNITRRRQGEELLNELVL